MSLTVTRIASKHYILTIKCSVHDGSIQFCFKMNYRQQFRCYMVSIRTRTSIKISYKLKTCFSFIVCRHMWHLLKFGKAPFFIFTYLIAYKKTLLVKITDSLVNWLIIQATFQPSITPKINNFLSPGNIVCHIRIILRL